MADISIANPPNAPAGYVAEWDGAKWEIVPITAKIIPAMPEGLPEGYTAEWNGSEWVVTPPPSPPPAPTPDQITAATITTAVASLQQIGYLATTEMEQHITQESKLEVTDYVHQVANILATGQQMMGTGAAYNPTFPPMPSVQHTATSQDPAPYIQFIVVN